MFKNEIATLCAYDIKSDPVIAAFARLGGKSAKKNLAAYAEICSTLLVSGKSLGDYLRDLLIYSRSALVLECAKQPTELRKAAISHDVGVIKGLSLYSSGELKEWLARRFEEVPALLELPDYEQGSFDYDADYFINFAAKNGSGMFAKYKAFTFDGEGLSPIESTDPIRLSNLKSYAAQRGQVVENTLCFLNRQPAQNVLLYGDRGTGKSSTVKAILNEFDGLRMVEVSKNDIGGLPRLFKQLKDIPLRFIVTIDDLTFAENDDRFGVLKAALEGSLSARPENILIYATTNRRKIIRETTAERSVEDISRTDAVDESMSLVDRFGLFITFSKPDKEGYISIVEQIFADRGAELPDRDRLAVLAERFALKHGGRSPRSAKQFADWYIARTSLNMEID